MKPVSNTNRQNSNLCALCQSRISVLTSPPRGLLRHGVPSGPLAEIMALELSGQAHYLCLDCANEVYNASTNDTGPTADDARALYVSRGLQPPPWLSDEMGLWYREPDTTNPWRCGACSKIFLVEWYMDGATLLGSPYITGEDPEQKFDVSLCDSCSQFLPHPIEIEPADLEYVALKVRGGPLLSANPRWK